MFNLDMQRYPVFHSTALRFAVLVLRYARLSSAALRYVVLRCAVLC